MSTAHIRPSTARRGLAWLARPDPLLLEFSSGGARHHARLRLGIFAGLAFVATAFHVFRTEPLAPSITGVVYLGLVISALIAWRVEVTGEMPGLPYIGATMDVSLVTSVLVGFALGGRPALAINSMFIWEMYLIAIMISALQLDLRVVAFSGAMALLQWAGLLVWVNTVWTLPGEFVVSGSDAKLIQGLRFGQIVFFALGAALIVAKTSRLVRLSGSDILTGLANRALFDQRLIEEIAVARRWSRSLSVAFLDIDHFKAFNDRFGHAAGDEALKVTARALIQECRESDITARWGGEEFVIVLPDSTGKDAATVVERIRARLALTPVPGISPDVRVVLSGGVAEFPTDAEEADQLATIADRRLLVAKRRGRNQVVSHD